jgi:hypothetical protein
MHAVPALVLLAGVGYVAHRDFLAQHPPPPISWGGGVVFDAHPNRGMEKIGGGS